MSASAGNAHLNVGVYTYHDCGDYTRVDPINVVFYGKLASVGNAVKHLEHHTGWTDDIGDDQVIWSHDACVGNQLAQRADDCWYCWRHHIRLFQNGPNQNGERDRYGRRYTAGDAHHDIYALCPYPKHINAAHGSNEAREILKRAFRGKHALSYSYWGNTRTVKQCDGTKARSDGNVLWLGSAR